MGRGAARRASLHGFVNSDWHKITKRGVSKAAGMERLCAALGLDPGEVMAFGDDLADAELLRRVGCGVAMGNAVPEVKRAADAVIGDCDTDAIADFLEKLYNGYIKGESGCLRT